MRQRPPALWSPGEHGASDAQGLQRGGRDKGTRRGPGLGSGPLRARGRGGEWHSEGSGAQDGMCAAGSAPWSTSVTLLRGEGSQVPKWASLARCGWLQKPVISALDG